MKKIQLKPHHTVMGVGGLILLVSVITGGGHHLDDHRVIANQARARAQAIRVQETEYLFDEKETALADEIAVNRYQNGLVFVVSLNDPNHAVGIIEGEPVVDRITRQPLADGTVVGDYVGNTGIIKNGVVSSIAFTGNQAVVDEAKEMADFAANEERQGHEHSNEFGG